MQNRRKFLKNAATAAMTAGLYKPGADPEDFIRKAYRQRRAPGINAFIHQIIGRIIDFGSWNAYLTRFANNEQSGTDPDIT